MNNYSADEVESSGMKMQPLEEIYYDEWDRFVGKARNGTIFHTAWWYKAWGVNFEIYARRNKKGEIEVGMPVYITRYQHLPRIFGVTGLSRPPLTIVNGPVFMESGKPGRSARNTHAKQETLCAISSLPKVDFYDIFLYRFQDDLMPYIWNGFDTNVYYTYVIPAVHADAWRDNASSNMRHNLKGAYEEADKRGCRVEIDPSGADTLPLVFETAETKGYTEEDVAGRFQEFWKAVNKKGAGRAYLLRDGEGRVLCSALMVWDTHSAYYLIGGMFSEERRRKGHLNMLLFERMITDAHGMGLDFDFEGSSLVGVERFFRGWGGELRPCFRATKIPSIWTYIGLKGHRYLKYHRNWRWVEELEPGLRRRQ